VLKVQSDLELLKAEMQHKQSMDRLTLQGSMSTEALIATSAVDNAQILASLKQHESTTSVHQKDVELKAQIQINEERSRLSDQINATERAKAEAIAEAYKLAMQSQHSSVNQMIQGLAQVGASHQPVMYGQHHPTTQHIPPPLQAAWYINLQNQQHGPYGSDQMKNFIAEKRVSPETMVWKTGMAAWMRADQCQELLPYINQSGHGSPPPFPGSLPPSI
jgi:hypothetical protein